MLPPNPSKEHLRKQAKRLARDKALKLADRVYALARGSIVLEAATGAADLPARLEHAYLATAPQA